MFLEVRDVTNMHIFFLSPKHAAWHTLWFKHCGLDKWAQKNLQERGLNPEKSSVGTPDEEGVAA